MNVENAFQQWLDGKLTRDTTRREHAELRGINIKDLEWAYVAGFCDRGFVEVLEGSK